MNRTKDTIVVQFAEYRIKLAIDRLKSASLTTAEFVQVVLRKLKSRVPVSIADVSYGLFERLGGIDRLIPDGSFLMCNKAFLNNATSEFVIRPKQFFELNGNILFGISLNLESIQFDSISIFFSCLSRVFEVQ